MHLLQFMNQLILANEIIHLLIATINNNFIKVNTINKN